MSLDAQSQPDLPLLWKADFILYLTVLTCITITNLPWRELQVIKLINSDKGVVSKRMKFGLNTNENIEDTKSKLISLS